MAALERVLDQRPCLLRVGDASVEFRDLALGQVTPASTSLASRSEHATDLLEREPRVLVEADERNALRDRRRVVPSLAGALGGWEQADPLVVAERRCRHAGAASELPDRHQSIIRHEISLDLKCASSVMVRPNAWEVKRMKPKQRLVDALTAQGGHPTGIGGRVVGLMMANRASNRKRNAWVVSLLDVLPDDRVF